MIENTPDNRSFVIDLIRANANVNTPPEWRESIKLLIAFLLSIGCWSVLGYLLCSQFLSSKEFADRMIKVPSQDTAQIAVIKDAQSMVDKTSTSIYALLTPIATAITGYFLVSSGTKKIQGEENQPPQLTGVGDPQLTGVGDPQLTGVGDPQITGGGDPQLSRSEDHNSQANTTLSGITKRS